MRAFCQRLVADPEYRASFEQRWRGGSLAPQLEAMIWAYAVGKPQQSFEVTRHGLSLAELIAGPLAVDGDDHEREQPLHDTSSGDVDR